MTNLTQRILSAAIAAPIFIGLLVWGGWPFTVLLGIAAGIGLMEWCRLGVVNPLPPGEGRVREIPNTDREPLTPSLSRRERGPATSRFWLWNFTGILYIGLPVLCIAQLRGMEPHGLWLTLWLFATVWATDIGGYAFGRTLGGPKLAPRISPNKTWAGLLGAMLCAAATGAGFAQALPGNWLAATLTGGALAVVAQMGDLFESWLKRRAGVKDSGALLPGHGGLLDRIDGLLAIAPIVWWLTFTETGRALAWWL
jgi:phosphatidate cytidylyltransferase